MARHLGVRRDGLQVRFGEVVQRYANAAIRPLDRGDRLEGADLLGSMRDEIPEGRLDAGRGTGQDERERAVRSRAGEQALRRLSRDEAFEVRDDLLRGPPAPLEGDRASGMEPP